MFQLPAPPPEVLVLLSLSLPCLLCVLIGGYTLACLHHKKLLELRLNAHRTNSLKMLLEKELVTKAREAEVSALRTENQELIEEVKCLKQIQGEVEGMMMEREAEFLELEEAWTKEKDELMRAAELSAAQHATEIAELTMSLEAVRVECASRGTEFRVLVEAKEHLETTHTKHEEKILELTDKLSEYTRLTRNLTAKDTPESSSLPALCERELPQKFPRVLETKSATTSPRRQQHPPRSPRKGT